MIDGYEQMATVMKALAHPVRLRILQILRDEEACVCHLEAILGQRQAYISQQLMRLREAGLVVDRREGLNVFYSLAEERLVRLLDTAHEIVELMAGRGGESLVFPSLDRANAGSCPCPVCQAKSDDFVPATTSRI
jgi:DNA-binding transcriptional ArsR family regulator